MSGRGRETLGRGWESWGGARGLHAQKRRIGKLDDGRTFFKLRRRINTRREERLDDLVVALGGGGVHRRVCRDVCARVWVSVRTRMSHFYMRLWD